MKTINRILIMLCVLCISWGVRAHRPDFSSTLLAEQKDNKWILQIEAALTAFEYEIHHHYGKGSYTTPEEFQELVVSHLRDNISISHNESNAVELQNGIVKLGHETSVVFEVAGIPERIQSLTVKNSSFSDISRNQSALIVLKKGYARDQFILDKSNEHRVELKVGDGKFELLTPTQEKTQYTLFIVVGTLLALPVFYLVLKKSKTIVFNTAPFNA